MLSKNNKILIGCLALLLVMSVGYALFSDTITINGTATAKGEFDIVTTCQTGILSRLGTESSLGLTHKERGYKNDTCSVVDDAVSLSAEFLYPGAARHFTIKHTNTGTIDASVNQNEILSTEKLCVANDLEGNGFECRTESGLNITLLLKGYLANMNYTSVAMEDPNGNLLSQSELLEFYDPTTGNAIIKPGYSIYQIFSLLMNHSQSTAPDGELKVMNLNYTATFEIPFTQVQ